MIYFHVGFPKSGSTTLQKKLFDKCDQINFLGQYPVSNIGLDSEYIKTSTHDASGEAVLSYFHESISHDSEIAFKKKFQEGVFDLSSVYKNNKVNVLSNERMASNLFSFPDQGVKARRVKECFDDSKIIIVIRNQFDIIKSQYRDHPFDPRSFNWKRRSTDIDKWVEIDQKNPNGFLASINYFDLLNYYVDLFGCENICVLLFEDMIHDLVGFSSKIGRFLDIGSEEVHRLLAGHHENSGVSAGLNKYRHYKNLLINILPDDMRNNYFLKSIDVKLMKRFRGGQKMAVDFSSDTIDFISGFYSEGNLGLFKKFGLEVEKYRYPGF
ncbi:sulfotransferase domain-containing protein [Reinekea thalattae]|uniref:Sulfotransferase domain-containing protein n=1 Tax=Reinekea thalattae TaxID=2593301 RepID=A0A5C8Z7Q2_9GAMM|nr:sulfotransferase domain-containing protein [Reinekea thalattae]TXR53349.1 hypothetical protein FME95_01905 [Reinekea thalattae]